MTRLWEGCQGIHSGVVPDNAPMVISVHIPKTAGTTFRSYLRAIYGRHLCCDYGQSNPMTHGLIARSLYADTGPKPPENLRQACHKKGIKCIHGHFHAEKYRAIFPDARYIVWLRDPVDRVISQFFYQRKALDPRNRINRLVYEGKVNLLQFADMEENRNIQSKMIAGIPVEAFYFLGICEDFQQSLRRFENRLQIDLGNTKVRWLNLNPRKPNVEDPEIREHIAAQNAADIQLHTSALGLFDCPNWL